jgi:hypothetical protein
LIVLVLFELIALVLVRLDQIRIVVVVVLMVLIIFQIQRIDKLFLLLLQLLELTRLLARVFLVQKDTKAPKQYASHDKHVNKHGVRVAWLVGLLDKAVLTKLVAKKKVQQDAGQFGEQTVQDAFEQSGELFVARRGKMRASGGGRQRVHAVPVLFLLVLQKVIHIVVVHVECQPVILELELDKIA